MTATAEHDGPSYALSGWIEAAIYVFAIGVLSLVYVVAGRLGAHPIAFVLDSMLLSAIVMLAITGLGPDWREIVLMPRSWLVGIGTIMMEYFYFVLLGQVGPAQGSIMIRLAIPASLAIGWVLFRRRPVGLQMAGAAIVAASILPLFGNVAPDRMALAAGAAAGCIAMFNLRSFAAEFHPANRRARGIKEKVRLTGLVVLVTSIAGLAAVGCVALAIEGGLVEPTGLVPSLAAMLHGPTLLLATFAGSVILTAMAYLNYSCVVKITTENFAAMTAFTPIATFAVQELAVHAGFLAPLAIDPLLMISMGVVVAGVMVMLIGVRRARNRA